jgi:shikimate dehydrogenase
MICCSFAKKAGVLGTKMHNFAAKYHDLDFIYKAFSITDIKKAIESMRTLGFRGAGITMPYKTEVIQYLDLLSVDAHEIGAVNTVVNNDGILIGHNTDWIAASEMIKKTEKRDKIVVLGNGGFAKAVKYAGNKLGYFVWIVNRFHWNVIPSLRDNVIFNCTPVEGLQIHSSNVFIDGITSTKTGKEMALIQASVQFELYTGKKFPYELVKKEVL